MSDNDTADGSVYNDQSEINQNYEDSGSEYQSDKDDGEENLSEQGADPTKSKSIKKGKKSLEAGPNGKAVSTNGDLSRTYQSSKTTYNDAYRNYYNDLVTELSDPLYSTVSVLPASDIGLTTWTPLEKELLFLKISTLGKDNVKGISEAIRNKSESEVREFIALLGQGAIEGNATKALPVFSAADVSAAFEVSKCSEEMLEGCADGLAQYQLKSDQKREQKRYGDYWLLTEEIAEDIEAQVMARDELYVKSNALDDENDDPEGETEAENISKEVSEIVEDETDSLETGGEPPDQALFQSQGPGLASTEPIELMVPAAELLDLPMWLRLSRLFMCQPPDLGDNWANLVNARDEAPSMYHTAFQDFHNLAISLTRRLVQATIFQAMTRLRARDKDRPSTKITSDDVRTAVDVLNMSPDMRKFWRGIPRRHGLRVYERSLKTAQGRSRTGAELNLEDVEERMGAGVVPATNVEANNDIMHSVEDGIEEEIFDPDHYHQDAELWTEASGSENEEPVVYPDQHSRSLDDDEDTAYPATDDEEAPEAGRKKRRSKEQMERNFRKAHDAYLEAVDQEMSRLHEAELWEALKLPPPKDIKDEEVEIPRQPVIQRRLSDNIDWRDNVTYQAPWEHDVVAVPAEEFTRMQHRGERARKRRRLAYEHLEKEGLIEIPQQEPDSADLRRTAAVDVEAETDDAPNVDATIPQQNDIFADPTQKASNASRNSFTDGITRKKLPNHALATVRSRASSVREGSQESSRSTPVANNALSNQLLRRKQLEEAERQEQLRLEEEEQEARRQRDRDRKREAKALKALSESERQEALKRKKAEKRKARQEAREAKSVTEEEEKHKMKDANKRRKKHHESLETNCITEDSTEGQADEMQQQEVDEQIQQGQGVNDGLEMADAVSEFSPEMPNRAPEQEFNGQEGEHHQKAVDVERRPKSKPQTKSRSKKSKRQSGF